jgi:DNA-binding response OmpR family regulator
MTPPRVLLLEGDEPLVRLLAWLFEDGGFEVDSVRSPAEALARFPHNQHRVVVLNTGLSPRQKDELMAEWRALAPATRFIDITERPITGAKHQKPSQADLHFEMPFDADDLLEAVRTLQI